MTISGWIFLILAWGFILSLTVYSVIKVLKNNK